MPTSDIVRINWILRLSVNEEDPILIDTIQCDWQQSHQVPNLATEEFANHMVTKHHQIEHHKIEICIFTTKTLIIHQSKRFSLVTIRNLQKTQIPITIWNLDTIIWSSEYFHPCDTSSDSWMNKNEKLRQKGEMDMFWYRVHLDRLYCHRVEQKKCFLNEKKSCFFLSKRVQEWNQWQIYRKRSRIKHQFLSFLQEMDPIHPTANSRELDLSFSRVLIFIVENQEFSYLNNSKPVKEFWQIVQCQKKWPIEFERETK